MLQGTRRTASKTGALKETFRDAKEAKLVSTLSEHLLRGMLSMRLLFLGSGAHRNKPQVAQQLSALDKFQATWGFPGVAERSIRVCRVVYVYLCVCVCARLCVCMSVCRYVCMYV